MMKRNDTIVLCLFVLMTVSSFFVNADTDLSRRMHAYLLLEDYPGAYQEAKEAWETDPHCKEKLFFYLKSLAALNKEREVLDLFTGNFEICKDDRSILEAVAWSVIRKGQESTQYGVRLISLIGAHLTNDAKAVDIILHSMEDQNAVIRSVAVHLAARFHDLPFQEKIQKMFNKEKIWFVRLELINAAGEMKIKALASELFAIAASTTVTYEERALAIESLVKIYDRVDRRELEELAHSPKGGLRSLACELVSHLHRKDADEIILPLLNDPLADVRVKALNTLALVILPEREDKEVLQPLIQNALKDSHPEVSITAGWVATRFFPHLIENHWEKWILQSDEEYARFAATALAATGQAGVKRGFEIISRSNDPYVKMNLALGLIGQRQHVNLCCDILVEGLKLEHKWMWDQKHNDLFTVLTPSRIRHVDHIPHYPEAVDQMTRLQLLSLLSIVEDPRAEKEIRGFLQKKKWGITGFAAVTLLREGDDASLEAVEKLLTDPDTKVRVQAALVMAFFGKDPSVVPILQEAYFQADHEMKGYILEAMGNMGTIDHAPFFMEAWQESSQVLRVIAASSFLQCLNH